jgi:hypothetical protein
MSKIEYKNRYGDVFTFSKTEDGNILMEGRFEFMRVGCPNVYEDAYGEYIDNTNPKDRLPLKEFIDEIHREVYNENDEYIGRTEIGRKYGELVYSDIDTINTIDPSGGPYLTEGMDMGLFDKSFKGMIIDQFKSVDGGYLILIKK